MTEWQRWWQDAMSSTADAFRAPLTPMAALDPFAAVLDAVRERVVGKPRTFRVGDAELTMVLDDVTVGGSELARSVGQYGHVRIAASDVRTPTVLLDRLVIEAADLHLRAGIGAPTLVAAPVRWEIVMDRMRAAARIGLAAPWSRLEFAGETVLVGLARHARWLRLEVAARAEGRSVRVLPLAVHVGSRRMRVRLPSYNVALLMLPEGDWLTDVEVGEESIVLRGVRTGWERTMTRADIERLVAAARGSKTRLEL